MRSVRRVLLSALLLATAATTQGAEPAVTTAVLSIPSMTCAACPLTVRKALQRVDGVKSVAFDIDAKTAAVTFDPSKTRPAALLAATADAGYPAELQP